MFLLRTGFWLAVVIMLLPMDDGNQQKFHRTASATMERVSTFCDRNAGTCEIAGNLWQTFLRKAEFAGRLALDMINGNRSAPEATSPPARVGGAGSQAGPHTPNARHEEPVPRQRGQRQGI